MVRDTSMLPDLAVHAHSCRLVQAGRSGLSSLERALMRESVWGTRSSAGLGGLRKLKFRTPPIGDVVFERVCRVSETKKRSSLTNIQTSSK